MSQLRARIQELAKHHGSLRAAARVLEIDHGYLSRLQDGGKTEPSDDVLRKLDLRRVVTYVRRSKDKSTLDTHQRATRSPYDANGLKEFPGD